MPLVISSQAFLRNVFRAGVVFGRLAYLATSVPYRQLDEDEDLENDERDVPEWGPSVAQGAKEGLAKCARIYADVEKWMRGIDRKAPVAPSFPKSSPLRVLETLLWKVESGFAGDLHTAGSKRKRYDFEGAELIAQGLLVPYLESYGGVWVIGMVVPSYRIVFFADGLALQSPGCPTPTRRRMRLSLLRAWRWSGKMPIIPHPPRGSRRARAGPLLKVLVNL